MLERYSRFASPATHLRRPTAECLSLSPFDGRTQLFLKAATARNANEIRSSCLSLNSPLPSDGRDCLLVAFAVCRQDAIVPKGGNRMQGKRDAIGFLLLQLSAAVRRQRLFVAFAVRRQDAIVLKAETACNASEKRSVCFSFNSPLPSDGRDFLSLVNRMVRETKAIHTTAVVCDASPYQQKNARSAQPVRVTAWGEKFLRLVQPMLPKQSWICMGPL